MFELWADKNKLTVQEKEILTSGSANVYTVQLRFSPDWDGFTKTALFRAGPAAQSVLPDGDGQCAIPREVLAEPGFRLFLGVCGRRGEETVLPTVWADLGMISEGAAADTPSFPPTPELWRQELGRKGDCLGYTEAGELGLYAGETLLASVPDRRTDHRFLSHREDEAQHPIAAISGLSRELERIPEPVEALTNMELEELLT